MMMESFIRSPKKLILTGVNTLKGFLNKKQFSVMHPAPKPDSPGCQHNGNYKDRLHGPVSREDVRHGFRLILGREPENDTTIAECAHHADIAAFRHALLTSEEFKEKYRLLYPTVRTHPDLTNERDTLVFIHPPKTAGTSLRCLLKSNFSEDRICPVQHNRLHFLSTAELAQYDFFSGHFDLSSIRFIPRRNIKTLSLFRNPSARLISLYRFHRAHKAQGEFTDNQFVQLANNLSIEEFFEQPQVRSSSAVYNYYLMAFGRSFSWFDEHRQSLSKSVLDQALTDAQSNICALTALGITERFDLSVKLIFKTLGLQLPGATKKLHVTDDFSTTDSRFSPVEPVKITSRLTSALEDLCLYDYQIYRYAMAEFERRCGNLVKE